MFDFFKDIGNYQDRVVGRHDYKYGFVSTARVSDGKKPYETAIKDNRYQRVESETRDDMCIIENYDNKKEAETGHAKWVSIMTDKPPKTLKDCNNGGAAAMGEEMFGDEWRNTLVWNFDPLEEEGE